MLHFRISVVHRSPGKMILNIQLCLVLIVAWINNAAGASVSKVYVHNHEPVEYYQYGSQAAIAYSNPQYAQLASAPGGSVVPFTSNYEYVPPCVPPSCLYPSQTIESVAAPSANIVSYQAPIASLPIVTASNRQDPGYEYSYIVYNQETGDKKSHSELSDGSVARGQYSFLQPDGYVREVKYVADELTGFNVVVKNYLPNTEANKKSESTGDTLPCPEVNNEHLTQKEPEHEADNSSEEKHALSSEGHSHESLVQGHEEKHEEGSHGHAPELPKEHEFNEAVETKEEHNKHSAPKPHEEHKVESHEEQKVASHKSHSGVSNGEVSHSLSSEDNILVSYSDIIKCITAALNKAQTGFSQPDTALRYIVLNKPC